MEGFSSRRNRHLPPQLRGEVAGSDEGGVGARCGDGGRGVRGDQECGEIACLALGEGRGREERGEGGGGDWRAVSADAGGEAEVD